MPDAAEGPGTASAEEVDDVDNDFNAVMGDGVADEGQEEEEEEEEEGEPGEREGEQ